MAKGLMDRIIDSIFDEYQLQLPDKSVLQKKLQELINMPLLEDGEADD